MNLDTLSPRQQMIATLANGLTSTDEASTEVVDKLTKLIGRELTTLAITLSATEPAIASIALQRAAEAQHYSALRQLRVSPEHLAQYTALREEIRIALEKTTADLLARPDVDETPATETPAPAAEA